MNATTPSSAAPEIPLTRAAKRRLLNKMFFVPLWTELIRLFRHQSLPIEKLNQVIQSLTKQHGKDAVEAAVATLVEVSEGKETGARLRPHVRRMASALIGPEPVQLADQKSVPFHDSATNAPAGSTRNVSAPFAGEVRSDTANSIMKQYRSAKESHPGMLLLFRTGDFYELFAEDAEIGHNLLGLTLTTRDQSVPMAGFLHHQLEAYLHKLLCEGQRVAICEQVEERPTSRSIARVVTPGVVVEEETPVRQPRVTVLKRCEAWMNDSGLKFVAAENFRKSSPAVVPFAGAFDFIVLRAREKLLVTVRPHVQAKHIAAMREFLTIVGTEYKPIRWWPCEGPNGWSWPDHVIEISEGTPKAKSRPRTFQSKKHPQP